MHSSSLLLLFIGGEIVDLVLQTGPVAKTVLVLLVAFSVLSWAVILSKWRLLNPAPAQSGRFIRSFRKAQRMQDIASVAEQFRPSPLVGVFDGAIAEFRRQMGTTGGIHNLVSIQRAMQIASSEKITPPRAQRSMAGDYRRGHAVYRTVRDRMGNHRRLPWTGHGGGGAPAGPRSGDLFNTGFPRPTA